MKNKIIITTFIILVIALFFINTNVNAQVPDPPDQDGESGDNAPGEGAPIGGGLLILLALGAGYGTKKLYDRKKKKLLE